MIQTANPVIPPDPRFFFVTDIQFIIRAMPAAAADAVRISRTSCQFGNCGSKPISAYSSTAASIPQADCKKVLAARRRGETVRFSCNVNCPLSLIVLYNSMQMPPALCMRRQSFLSYKCKKGSRISRLPSVKH